MRVPACALLLLTLIALVGCYKPQMRPDPIEFSGTVKLPGGVSPKGLTVTFQPQQNSLGTTAKVGADGKFTASAVPGKYVFYFSDETNVKVPAFKGIPEKYRSPSEENSVTVSSGAVVTITVN